MKKILTLFTMLLVTASTLLAQAPSLSYQMIVRNQKTADVTVGEKVFHTNDLIYSQPMDVYAAVVEANGNVAKVWAFIGNANSNSGNGMIAQQVTTNMNGMLSLTLNDYESVELPADYSVPATVGAQVNLKPFKAINWKDAKIVVAIPEYGIMDTMDILPVPYAYNVYTDSSITTERIVRYIDNAQISDVDSVFGTAHANTNFMNAATINVADLLKNNPDMVKALAIYFLGKVDSMDVINAYDTINDATMDYITGKIKEYAKNHKDDAYEVLGYYVRHTTPEDVQKLWTAAMSASESIDTIVMIVNDYIYNNHIEWIKKAAKYAVNHVSVGNVQHIQDYFKSTNPAVYEAAEDILDSFLLDCLKATDFQSGAECGIDNLCDLRDQIHQATEHFVICPMFGNTTLSNDQVSTPIASNLGGVSLNEGSYYYVLSFPNSTYQDTLIVANYANNGITASIPETYLNRQIKLTPKMKVACMETATYGEPKDYNCNNCENPAIASFTHTSNSAADLLNNHGVALTAKLTSNYYANNVVCGFEYKEATGNWTQLGHTEYAQDNLTFSDTLKMNFCGKELQVRPFVKVGDNNPVYGNVETIQMREVRLVISPADPVLANNNTVELTATNGIKIGTESLINEFHTNWPSIEQIVDAYGADFGVSEEPEYKWTYGTSTSEISTSNKVTATQTGWYHVTCSFSVFNSDPCVLSAEVEVR